MIEKAVFCFKLQNKNENKIIYVGSETCQNIALKSIKNLSFKEDMVLTLPVLSDTGIGLFEKEIDNLLKNKKLKELVLNDYGSIVYFRKKYKNIKINAGRILMMLFEKNYNSTSFINYFMKKFNINAVEIDGSFNFEKLNGIFPVYYHTPFSITAITRFCPWEKLWNSEKCLFSCEKKIKKLVSDKLEYDLYLKECYYLKKISEKNIKKLIEL